MRLAKRCPAFGKPVHGTGYGADLKLFTLTPAGIDAILRLDTSVSFWKKRGDYGYFDQPEDVTLALRVQMWTQTGKDKRYERWLHAEYSASTDRYYLMAFATIIPFADKQGKHFGTHPCAAFRYKPEFFEKFLAELKAGQGVKL